MDITASTMDEEALSRIQEERWARLQGKQKERLFFELRRSMKRAQEKDWKISDIRDDGFWAHSPFLVDGGSRLAICLSGAIEDDGKLWLHLSISHKSRLPTWEELVQVKELFLGEESTAYKVIPPRSKYVNIMPTCLHLFRCMDDDPLPDFTAGSGSI